MLRGKPCGVGEQMLDFVYIMIAILFFVACWVSAKACDRL
jgi:hypothetical protein